ncbi:MAG: PoNe immunity protein domain-containing protein, partial [Breznakia sp.]
KIMFDIPAYGVSLGKIIDIISLFILFNEQEKAKEIYDTFFNEQEKDDWILNFLMSDDISDLQTIKGKVKFKKFDLPIQKLILEGDIEKVKKHMEKKWYKANNDAGWYDDHKSPYNIYNGYWAFDIGAIVKKLKLDDSVMKDVDYYPYDLVHY